MPAIPACLGWPETRELLETHSAPTSPFMTLAAGQGFTETDRPGSSVALTSFTTLCDADLLRNRSQALLDLAESLNARLSESLQAASNDLLRTFFLDVLLEILSAIFHERNLDGRSLTVFMAAYGASRARRGGLGVSA